MSKVFVVVPVSNANNNDNRDSILCPTKFESSDYLVLFFLPIILLSSPYSYQLLTFSCHRCTTASVLSSGPLYYLVFT